MQNSEGGSDSPASVALCPAAASGLRVLVQTAGSAPKGAQMQPISLPRVQQVPQQVQPVQHVYPPQVQYVEGGDTVYTNGALRTAYAYNPEPQMYAPSSTASYFEAPGGAQVTVAGSSPPVVPSHSMVGITMDVGGSPIVSSAGAYLIHGGMDGTRHSLAHTSRSSPATLQWLLDNYETAEGVSLPRSSLYNHYLRHCQEHKLDPVNAASFGKLIRSVFMGLRTRRLGTRGNSKYHYYGIRLKPDSPLNRLQEDTQYMAMRQQPLHQKPSLAFSRRSRELNDGEPEGAVLPKDKLVSLCKCEPILKWMRNCDHILYQALVEILIPDVLRPVPSTLTQAIRNFAKSLEGWLTNAMRDFPQQAIQTKVGVVSAFAQTLRRYTSLNHLAQAARAVLQNTSQINQMLSDLNRVDFANVQVTLPSGVLASLLLWPNSIHRVAVQHCASPVPAPTNTRLVHTFGLGRWLTFTGTRPLCEAPDPRASLFQFNDLASLSLTLLDKEDLGEDRSGEADPDAHGLGEPLVKRERGDPNHSLQGI
uniref:DNA-binding protein RFX2 n=1 Tax=Panthera tigris altaica TaxID=74533 RepID=A0A8C9M7E7_PANTA